MAEAAGIGYIWCLPSPKLIYLSPLYWRPAYLQRPKAEAITLHHFLGGSDSHLVAYWLHWNPSITGGGTDYLCRKRCILWIRICFLCLQCLCQHHHGDSHNNWFITMVSHSILLPTKELSLAWRKCGDWLILIEFIGLISCPITEKQLAWYNGEISCWRLSYGTTAWKFGVLSYTI